MQPVRGGRVARRTVVAAHVPHLEDAIGVVPQHGIAEYSGGRIGSRGTSIELLLPIDPRSWKFFPVELLATQNFAPKAPMPPPYQPIIVTTPQIALSG